MFGPDRFSFSFRITGDQWAVGSWRRFGFAEHLNPIVDLFFEFVFVDEAVDLHGAEEVADAFADTTFGNFLAQGKGRCEGSPVGAA